MSSAVNAAEHAACQLHASPSHTCVLTFDPTKSFVDFFGFLAQTLQSHVKVHSSVQARVSASYPKNNQGRGGR